MKKETYAIIILLSLLIIINYSWLDSKLTGLFIEEKFGIVERIVDGDTVIINGNSTRLLGINCPEKGEEFSNKAKQFLEENILNKTVKIEYGKSKKDRYGRNLAYIFLNEKNINLEIIKQGFANPYFPSGKDKYYYDFYEAWENCEINFCEKSSNKCANCIKLKKFDYKNEKIIFKNICSFDCNLTKWTIKDEGRKKFVFENFVLKSLDEVEIVVNGKGDLVWKGEDYVWTKSGDTLFLRDEKNRLVLEEKY